MKSFIHTLAVSLIASTPLIAAAQADGPQDRGPRREQSENTRPPREGGERPQRPPGGGGGPLQRMQEMRHTIDELNLTEDQRAKIDDIFEKTMEEMRAAGESLRKDINAVLTEEQRATLREKMQQAGPRPGPQMLEHLRHVAEELDLTSEQKQQVEEILADARKQFAELRDSGKQGPEIREAAEKILADVREKMDKVLTSEQRDKLEEMRKQGPPPGEGRGPGPGGARRGPPSGEDDGQGPPDRPRRQRDRGEGPPPPPPIEG